MFDLEAFSAAMPRHWQENPQADPWRTVRTWSTGQLIQLREGLERVARRARGPVWPEYSELECFTCHHGLTRPEDSWRQEQGFQNRRPGNPPWNHSRVVIARHVIRAIDPGAAERFDADLAKLALEISKLQGDRGAIAETATRLSAELDAVARRAAGAALDRTSTLRFMRAIAADGERIAAYGERSAEQAAMSLEALYGAYTRNAKDLDERGMRGALDALFKQLENPSAYDPRRFAGELRRVRELLPTAGTQ